MSVVTRKWAFGRPTDCLFVVDEIRPPRYVPGMEKPAPDWQDRLSRLAARKAVVQPDVVAARLAPRDRSDA